ncbi:hypothetical protein CK203_019362 [Vitis vinifera]|uniref:Retrovirus-related Pol polyprotein from transposon TNT 1-94 n=1 Tax=Vitis vinifera TaxID=29760 RepID=A0A438IZ89_VITVI|nr:hypothetical protein CK203_019362 [Vitis vinifera]
MLMENFLHSKKYWSIVENGIPSIAEGSTPTQVQRKEVEEARLKDMKTKNYLFQSIDKTIMKTFLTITHKEYMGFNKAEVSGLH